MEKITELGLVNGQSVQIVHHEGEVYVPIKPICEILGVNYTTQAEKLKNHPAFSSSVATLRGVTGADRRQYSLTVIPLMFFFGWICNIEMNEAKEGKQKELIIAQVECNKIFYNAFFRTSPKKGI